MKQPEPSLGQEWYGRVASNHLSTAEFAGLSITFIITMTFSSQTSSDPVKSSTHQLLNKVSTYVPCLDNPVCVSVSFVNKELSQTVKQPSDSNRRDKLLMNNLMEI
ncbi:hypothetical protein AVEN_258973-1 [Araneus ventricosus]|uniref:Uncharacterized protein n=1 Tax=Araneus ventricosus TaxID=182803 RepID=A0A4Y2CFR8_ARAVE|nr:hypothetical protein AVEN_258973-1 [Araneus ventricosus]